MRELELLPLLVGPVIHPANAVGNVTQDFVRSCGRDKAVDGANRISDLPCAKKAVRQRVAGLGCAAIFARCARFGG